MQRLIVNVPRTILEKKHDRIKIDKVDGSVDHEILHRVIHQKVDLVCKLIVRVNFKNLKLSIHTNRISPSVASLTPSPGMKNRDLEKDSTLKCTLLNIKQPVS